MEEKKEARKIGKESGEGGTKKREGRQIFWVWGKKDKKRKKGEKMKRELC